MASLADLLTLGYTVDIAHGDVQRERDYLEALEKLEAEAPSIAALDDALNALDDAIQALPEGDQRREMQGQADGIRLNMAAMADLSGQIEQQRRAVAEAENMPTVYVVSGPGIGRMYVAEDDQAMIDQLADPAAHSERLFQQDNPDMFAAAAILVSRGYKVERPEPGQDVFIVDGTSRTGAQIIAFVRTAKAKPSVQQKVAQVLLTAPELGPATRAALEEALGGPQP